MYIYNYNTDLCKVIIYTLLNSINVIFTFSILCNIIG